jgi:hypothetical protein
LHYANNGSSKEYTKTMIAFMMVITIVLVLDFLKLIMAHKTLKTTNTMKTLKETLTQRFYTYFCYDQVASRRFEDPSPSNAAHWERVRKDAERMADIAVKEIKELPNLNQKKTGLSCSEAMHLMETKGCKVGRKGKEHKSNIYFTAADLLANDWEVIE